MKIICTEEEKDFIERNICISQISVKTPKRRCDKFIYDCEQCFKENGITFETETYKPKWKHICATGACYYECEACTKRFIVAASKCPHCGAEMGGIE